MVGFKSNCLIIFVCCITFCKTQLKCSSEYYKTYGLVKVVYKTYLVNDGLSRK